MPIRQAITTTCAPYVPLALQTTWVKPAQMHVALALIGDSSPAFLPHLKEALNNACAGITPFECSISGFGYEGSRRNPTIIWMGVEPREPLFEMHEHLWRYLKKLGYTQLNERFTPHIRIAYCKSKAKNRAVLAAMDADDDPVFDAWSPAYVSLFESRTTPRGSEYRPLHKAPLAT